MKQELTRYLKRVRRHLNMPNCQRDRVISDLTTTITAMTESGMDVDQILKELGSPKKTAREFNEQMKEFTYKKSPWRFVFLAVAVLAGAALAFEWIISLILGDIFNVTMPGAVGVIGGADGPTSVFITKTVSTCWQWLCLLLIGLIGYWIFCRIKRKD